MKKTLFLLVAFLIVTVFAMAQTKDSSLVQNKEFNGANALKDHYYAIFQLDQSDPKVISKTIRNINNALSDPRLAGKLTIELIAFSGGTDAYLKGSKFEKDLKELVKKGVIIAQCHNTLVERNINPDNLYDFIAIVPSGTGELILRQSEGWAVVKP